MLPLSLLLLLLPAVIPTGRGTSAIRALFQHSLHAGRGGIVLCMRVLTHTRGSMFPFPLELVLTRSITDIRH